MYTTYFGFREPPFNLTPSPHFFYTNSIYDGAFETIEQGIRGQRGMLLLTGEVGTGKTTLLRRLVHALDEDPSIQVVSLYYTMLAFEEFLSFLCEDLGLAVKMLDVYRRDAGAQEKIQALNTFLHTQAKDRKTTALFIDEAQDLETEVLENLLQLIGPQEATEKLLQIILVGQYPELTEKLTLPSLDQLSDSIAVRYELEQLTAEEVTPFVQYRIRTAGCEREDLFQPEALQLIAEYSDGNPRVINTICDNSLKYAYEAVQQTVSAKVIHTVAENLQLSRTPLVIGESQGEGEQAQAPNGVSLPQLPQETAAFAQTQAVPDPFSSPSTPLAPTAAQGSSHNAPHTNDTHQDSSQAAARSLEAEILRPGFLNGSRGSTPEPVSDGVPDPAPPHPHPEYAPIPEPAQSSYGWLAGIAAVFVLGAGLLLFSRGTFGLAPDTPVAHVSLPAPAASASPEQPQSSHLSKPPPQPTPTQEATVQGITGSTQSAESAAAQPKTSPQHVQKIEEGKRVFETLTAHHNAVQPMVWGLATQTPAVAFLLPETDWKGLPLEDQVNLSYYLESLIPAVRTNPSPYLAEFSAAPDYSSFLNKVANLCADCWVIGVGPLASDSTNILVDTIVVQGDSLWDKAPVHNRGVKASAFRLTSLASG